MYNKRKGKTKKRYNAFTLIELLLVLGLLVIIAAFTIPISNTYIDKNNISVAKENISSSIRIAQSYSTNMRHDDSWGINIGTTEVILFKGSDFLNRDISFDENFPFSSEVSTSGLSEILFTKQDGIPTVTGTITIIGNTGETRTVLINSKGLIDEQ